MLKQLLAVLSLIFPKLLTIRRSPRQVDAVTKEEEFVYTSLFELRKSKPFAEDKVIRNVKSGTSNDEGHVIYGDGDGEV